jgi:hypothetical protein
MEQLLRYATETYKESGEVAPSFLTSVLDGASGQLHALAATSTHWIGVWDIWSSRSGKRI